MDPDAALAKLRELVTDISSAEDESHIAALASDMVDVFVGLDEWIARGGFLPRLWNNGPKRQS